jgi:hypothetical protein
VTSVESNGFDLSGANLAGADVRCPDVIDEVTLEGAHYNADTKFPETNRWDEPFSADAQGAIPD